MVIVHNENQFTSEHFRVNMRLEPHVPTVQEALQYFQDSMAHGRPPIDPRERRRATRFEPSGQAADTRQCEKKQPILEEILVTPAAMALEQAKAELRAAGEYIPDEKRRKTRKGGVQRKITQTDHQSCEWKLPIVKTVLVTPAAMGHERAKAQLRAAGEYIPGEK